MAAPHSPTSPASRVPSPSNTPRTRSSHTSLHLALPTLTSPTSPASPKCRPPPTVPARFPINSSPAGRTASFHFSLFTFHFARRAPANFSTFHPFTLSTAPAGRSRRALPQTFQPFTLSPFQPRRRRSQSGSSPANPKFSNDWKIFFQWLEKMAQIFQRLEKFFGSFPMIGKIFGSVSGNKKNKKDNKTSGEQKGQTITTIPDNSFLRQLGQHGTTCALWTQ